jgi:hypothetical protein
MLATEHAIQHLFRVRDVNCEHLNLYSYSYLTLGRDIGVCASGWTGRGLGLRRSGSVFGKVASCYRVNPMSSAWYFSRNLEGVVSVDQIGNAPCELVSQRK